MYMAMHMYMDMYMSMYTCATLKSECSHPIHILMQQARGWHNYKCRKQEWTFATVFFAYKAGTGGCDADDPPLMLHVGGGFKMTLV